MIAPQFGAPASYRLTCQMIDIQPDQIIIRQGGGKSSLPLLAHHNFTNCQIK
jgi:hypothetical protein